MSLPLGLALMTGCFENEFNIRDYLELQCEGNAALLERASFEIDLIQDNVVKLGEFELKSLGLGELEVVNTDENKASDPLVLDSSRIKLNFGDIEYLVGSKSGEAESTIVQVSRSCERQV